MTIRTGSRLTDQNPGIFKDTKLLTVANAIDSLAPDSPIFPVLEKAERSPDVKYHNIIGVLQKPSFITSQAGPGDGVVSQVSAGFKEAESELIVDADHTKIHMNNKTIFEVRRILLEHLREVDAGDRVAGEESLVR
jgi:hypothetical protein